MTKRIIRRNGHFRLERQECLTNRRAVATRVAQRATIATATRGHYIIIVGE